MISFREARERVRRAVAKPLSPEMVPVEESVDRILAEDVVSPVDLPFFTNSAMDGVAVVFPPGVRVLPAGTGITLRGTVRAGTAFSGNLQPLEGVWVFTGAPVPPEAHGVAMREILEPVSENRVRLKRSLARGEHIRRKGEEIRRGQRVLRKGTVLTPAGVGFLAAMGLARVAVYRRPRVALFTTGDEVVLPGEPRGEAQIYNSNRFALASALRGLAETVYHRHLPDERAAVEEALEKALNSVDVVLFTGGVSAGDHDHVRDVLRERITPVFYKVAQKPGKPLFFGSAGDTFVFGLPGNPVSALVCFYEYVYPLLRALSGHPRPDLPVLRAKLLHDVEKKPGRTWLLRGVLTSRGVRILSGQGSHMMAAFARAGVLVVLPARRRRFSAGERVTVHRLPTGPHRD